jgi:copper chaperone
MQTKTLQISGMSCGHCVSAVRASLAAVSGITVDAVEVGSATITFDPAIVTLSDAERAIDDAGFDVVSARVLNVASAEKLTEKSDA